MNVVDIDGITKTYNGQTAVSDVSLTIAKGEVFALLGPNGAGKTTLLRILTGILQPDSGTVQILGTSGMAAVRDQVGYLPEERGLYKKQKVGDTLTYLGQLKGLSRRKARERARTVLHDVGMEAHENSKPEQLSKGMAQRIQIAAALVHDPPFVILDEPFSGLDPVSARQAQEVILAEKAKGRTVLLSTHQMEPVERLCDRLLMLHRGKTVLYGTVHEVRERFSEGVLRVEHDTERLPSELPSGFAVREAAIPHTTLLHAPTGMGPREALVALLASGAQIRGFAAVVPGLEDIFVRIVGEKG